jgi:hypothetical protein
MAAMALDCPPLAMSEDDARSLSTAVSNVMRHYSIEATQKAIDIGVLVSTLGALYLPRGVALVTRMRRGNTSRPANAPPPAAHAPASADPYSYIVPNTH